MRIAAKSFTHFALCSLHISLADNKSRRSGANAMADTLFVSLILAGHFRF